MGVTEPVVPSTFVIGVHDAGLAGNAGHDFRVSSAASPGLIQLTAAGRGPSRCR